MRTTDTATALKPRAPWSGWRFLEIALALLVVVFAGFAFYHVAIQTSVTPDEINYCMRCGSRLAEEERFGRLRPVCPACGWIYFADPKVAAAVLVEQGGRRAPGAQGV